VVINREISKEDCKKLSIKIKDDFYRPVNEYKSTIFLCGADLKQKEKFRYQIAGLLMNDWRNSFYYDVIFPEDIFDDLLYSSKRQDLLSLENMLADSVDVIVIIPESPGSFAELGAFANDAKLREKIICIIDSKFKKDKSFINEGPVKLVRKNNKEGVIFIDPDDIKNSVEKLISVIKKFKKKSSKKLDKISLLQLENYILPSIFLLEPVTKEILQDLTAYATEDGKNSYQATVTALTALTKKRKIEMSNEGYRLTSAGLDSFFNLKKTSSSVKSIDETIALDNLRLEILNYKLRNKKLRV
jgi:hypothetical protein